MPTKDRPPRRSPAAVARGRRSRRRAVGFVVLVATMVLAGVTQVAADSATSHPAVLNVLDAPYWAAGDGITNDRLALQHALDDAAGTGATVLIPAGHTFKTGSLGIGSRTTVRVEGTLLQSQNADDYSFTPVRGHNLPPTPVCNCLWDHGLFHNEPFLYAGRQHDVRIVGHGTVQMTQDASDDSTIHLTPVGFYRVSHYLVSDVHLLGAVEYNMSLFTTDHGTVRHVTILPATGGVSGFHANTDGISLQNSQHIRITGNTISNGDDAIYIWASYRDPRSYASPLGGMTWWSSDDPQASTDIEIDHNDVAHTPGIGAGFIAWGSGAPDQRSVTISHVRIHDNTLTSTARAIGCWCDNPYRGQQPFTDHEPRDQSPITDVRIDHNSYPNPAWEGFTATDLRTEYGLLGSRTVQNGSFDQSTAWWSARGAAGAVDASAVNSLHDPKARAALGRTDGHVGYLQPGRGQAAELFEGLGVGTGPGDPAFDTTAYRVTADVVTGARPARLVVRDTCTGRTLASTSVRSPVPTPASLVFRIQSECDDVHVGLEQSGADGRAWALVDNVAIDNVATVVDDLTSGATYTGRWDSDYALGAFGNTNETAQAAGAVATIPFTGRRAVLLALKNPYQGIAEIGVDGGPTTAVDMYAAVRQPQAEVYDTGELSPGPHVLRIVETGTKEPAATSALVNWDALLVEPDAAVPGARTSSSKGQAPR